MQENTHFLSRRAFLRRIGFTTGALLCGAAAAGCGGGGGSETSSAPSYSPNLSQFTPNYGSEITLDHWPALPVRVYFANDIAVTPKDGRPTRVNSVIQTGFNRWSAATGGVVGYHLVTDPAQADITVSVTTVPDPVGLSETGKTSVRTGAEGGLQLAMIEIYIWPDITDAELTQGLLATATHEFGHALGIAGHSSNAGDVMYILHQPGQDVALTARDVNTVKTLYYFLF